MTAHCLLTISLLFALECFATGDVKTTPSSCFRPQDMSNSKAVQFFEECKNKNEKICEKNLTAKTCAAHKKPVDFLKRFPTNTNDINPNERCTVYKDGSYRCLQDPVRFIAKEKTIESPVATPSPVGEGGVDVPTVIPAAPLGGADKTALPGAGSSPAPGK